MWRLTRKGLPGQQLQQQQPGLHHPAGPPPQLRGLLPVAGARAKSSTPQPAQPDAATAAASPDKPKRKYTRRASAAPTTPAPATPPPPSIAGADEPAKKPRKARATSTTPAPASLPASALPWVVQQEGDGATLVASGKARARSRTPAAARKLQRGASAVEGDALSKRMVEETVRTDSAGKQFVDRAALGRGMLEWYGVGVSGAWAHAGRGEAAAQGRGAPMWACD